LVNGSASLQVTNSLGNTHGLIIGQDSTTLSGGSKSTTMTLNNNGASFANSTSGAPVKVTGIADGTSSFDAVNVRQFSSAIAGVQAAANIPGLDTNKSVSIGVGLGSFMGQQALSFGGSYRFSNRGVVRGSLSTGMNDGNKTSFGIGAGWSW
jgi:autotransporter adhesin